MQNNRLLPTTEDMLDQVGQVLLQQRFYSDDSSWTEYYLVAGTSRTIYYATQNDKKTLLWSKPTSEIWVWELVRVSSLWYFIWEEWIVRMNLNTWDVSLKLIFLDIGIWSVSRIDIIKNMIFWSGGICNFLEDRGMIRSIMGEFVANEMCGNIERDIQWKYTSDQLWIGYLEEVFSDVYGNIIIGKQWIVICDWDGNLLCRKEYSDLGIQEVVQIYKNWWIIGRNEKVQLNFKDGTILAPATPLDIKGFIRFRKENSHSLMEPLEWTLIWEESQNQNILQPTAKLAMTILN